MRPYFIVALLLVSTWTPQGIVPAYGKPKESPDPSQVCPVTAGRSTNRCRSSTKGRGFTSAARSAYRHYQADPARYAVENAKDQLAATRQVKQVACPFTGKPSMRTFPRSRLANDVWLSLHRPPETVANADPEARFGLVFGDAFAKGFAVQKK